MKQKKHLHEKLGITFRELGALLATRELLKNENIVHSKNRHVVAKVHKFNMAQWCDQHSCGTVSCIGGTMSLILGYEPENDWTEETDNGIGFHALFFPQGISTPWHKITAPQAIKAINNFLKDGKPRWNKIVK